MIQAPENYVLVEIEKKFQDEQGGFLIDTTWHPEEFATVEGVVISAPVRMVSDPHRTVVSFVKNGDHIFFSYGVIFEYDLQPDNDTPVYRNLVTYKGKEYWRVQIGDIFCKIDNDRIEMVTDHVLIDPYQPKQKSYAAVYLPEVDFRETGHVVSAPPGKSFGVDDLICFESRFVQQYHVFGKVHFVIPSRRVLAKFN